MCVKKNMFLRKLCSIYKKKKHLVMGGTQKGCFDRNIFASTAQEKYISKIALLSFMDILSS